MKKSDVYMLALRAALQEAVSEPDIFSDYDIYKIAKTLSLDVSVQLHAEKSSGTEGSNDELDF